MRSPGCPFFVVVWIWCALICACHAQPANAHTNNLPCLTTAGQVRDLSALEANKAYPVKLHGVILCSELDWYLWFIQDEAGDCVYLFSPQSPTPIKKGQTVELEGQTREGQFANIIVNSTLKPSEKPLAPRASHPSYEHLSSGKDDGYYVQIQGRVRSAVPTEKGTYLTVWMGSNFVSCVLMHTPSTNLDYLIDSQVRVSGVCAAYGANRKISGFRIFVPTLDLITVEESAKADPWAAPSTHLAALARLNQPELGRRVRVMGRVIGKLRAVSLTLQDDTGTALLNCQQTLNVKNGDIVEAIGFPAQNNDGIVVKDAEFRPVSSTNIAISRIPNSSVSNPNPPLLTRIDQIRRLPPEEYNRSYPVQIEGVVTVWDTVWKLLFISDDSGGLFIDGMSSNAPLKVGQRVHLEGFSAPGKFSPIITDPVIKVIGTADWPPPRIITYSQAITGQEDAQWTKIVGVVHQVRYEGGHIEITLAAHGEQFRAFIETPNATDLPMDLINARVAITGVCASRFNEEKQIVGVLFHLPELRNISILDPAPENPFAGPTQSINRLMRFNPGNGAEQRIHIQGVVTLRLAQDVYYIQDDTDGIQVTTTDKAEVQVGDKVDAAGFVSAGQYQPCMNEALISRVGSGTIPQAVNLDFAKALSGDYDGHRVTVEGNLLLAHTGGSLLSINNNGNLFEVRLIEKSKGPSGTPLLPGTYLQITGVCKIQANEYREPTSLSILAASAADIVVLKRPPWWTTEHTLQVTSILIAAILAVGGWVLLLRRRVSQQTGEIRTQYEKTSILERRFRAFVETANDAIIMTEAESGLILNINKKAEVLLGRPAFELVGKPYTTCHPPEKAAHYEKFLEQFKNPGSLVTPAELYSSKDKRIIPVEVSATTFEYYGQVIIQGIYRDTSERVRLEEQLRQGQKMQSIGQLAAGIAHDFNNMLTVIQGHTGLLLAHPHLDSNAMESVNEIKDATRRAADLTRQLLAFSRKQMLQPQPVNLNTIVNGMITMLRRMLGEQIQLHFKHGLTLPCVFADPGMMEQIIMNLVVNARDAMPKGGELVLSTESIELNAAQCAGHAEARAGHFVLFTASDNGCGMDPTTLTRIFEPFYTTKDVGKGTGLGLATAYGIIKQHNGWIDVVSEPGKGSTFKIFLPTTDKTATLDVRTPKPKVRDGAETILIVENDMSVRLLARTILRRQGFHIFEAVDAAEAAVLWQQHQNSISLIMTDLSMSDGTPGTELVGRFCAEKQNLRCVYTSNQEIEVCNAGLSLREGYNFIRKPFTAANLIRTVRNGLDEQLETKPVA